MHSTLFHYKYIRPGVIGLAMLLMIVLWSSRPATAQDVRAFDNAAPPRGVDREAPTRQPVVLANRPGKDGRYQTILEIPPVADSYIASERPFENFGADALFLGYNLIGDHYGAERTLLYFDVLNWLPENAVIDDADLQLHLSFASPGNDEPMGTALRRLASAWNEYGVTWHSEPVWAEVRATADVPADADWITWHITDLVDDWYDGTFENEGVEIIGDERVQQRERVFYSRETQGDKYPRLIITYTATNDNQAPIVTVDPLPDYVSRNFDVSWSGSDRGAAGIDYYDIQYRVEGDVWIDWLNGTTETSAQFPDGQNGRSYEFRARGVDNVGNVEPYGPAEAATTVDSLPPTATVNPLPLIIHQSTFTVSWSGDDGGGSGIDHYDIRYRYNNGPWTLWLQDVTSTAATFTASDDGVYAFEARATDQLGRTESWTAMVEAETAVDVRAPFMTTQSWLPMVARP